MIEYSPCKINLGLEIIDKRSDGYHNIESVFYPVPLFDIIEINRNNSKDFNYTQSGFIVDTDIENNLLYKAWNLIQSKYNIGGIDVHLHKQIPMGAGLGGGSSNAVTLIRMLIKEFKLDVLPDEFHHIAKSLGSDCPFFIDNKPVFVFNTGTDFRDIDFSLKDYYLVIVKAPISVSTQQAYEGVQPKFSEFNLLNISQLPIKEWERNIVNRFEEHIFKIYPELQKIKDKLLQMGAQYSAMSGSGSAIYGIFKEQPKPLDFPVDYFVWDSII